MASTLQNLLNRLNACKEARDWIATAQITKIEDAWAQCPDPSWMLSAANYAGDEAKFTKRVWAWVHGCLLRVTACLRDPRCLRALKVLEAHVHGTASDADLADALASARAALDTRTRADAAIPRASADFHAARAVVAALTSMNDQWQMAAASASVYAALAAAQTDTGIDRTKLAAERSSQTELLRSVFAGDVGQLFANVYSLC